MSKDEKNKKNTGKVILIIIAILMIVVGLGWFGMYMYQTHMANDTADDTTQATIVEDVTDQTMPDKKIKNPIDFASLHKKNDEIYAWLKVPGTKVDYPVCQSPLADDFYLKHDAYTKEYSASGAIYSQMLNTTSFKDRVTVIYGHNGYGDTFFTTLHNFENNEFFNSHKYFYIYTPNSKLTYQIVSAFKYDDRHLLNSFDMSNTNVFDHFLDIVQHPESTNANVRTALDKDITNKDNIVVLSTCITNQPSNRYLVCGVLVKDEATN